MASARNNVLAFLSLNEIEDFLRTDLRIAQIRREKANSYFWHVHAEVSDADRDQKLQSASEAQCAARQSVLLAVNRLTAFLVSGAIPDEFRLRIPVARSIVTRVA
jgi:hypothetical protein